MIKTTTPNNLGAINALKGYKSQFLYSLSRILSYTEHEAEFHPEGKFEDLDIYGSKGELIEIAQVKDLAGTLTLSNILSPKENTFIRRALNACKENKNPKIKLVSFGKVNEDIKNLSTGKYPPNLVKKLKNQGLKDNEITMLENSFELEIVGKEKTKENIVSEIEKWGNFPDLKITVDLLTYWVYHAAEKQRAITPLDFKSQFGKICKFQNERASFNTAYNSLIQPLDNELGNEDKEHLESDFYKGISATYKHILAGVDVPRIEKLQSIKEKFGESNIVFIHGASGQGKSALAYRYLHEYCAGTTVFELKHLPEDIAKIYETINALEGISKGIRFPITIYIDVEPGNKEWVNILRELAAKKNVLFLATIREEDWNSIEVGDKFDFSEVELSFDRNEAALIYEALDNYNKDLKFLDFENAWDTFGGKGPLLEFVYLVTQNQSLSAKLKSQINKIRGDTSGIGNEKIILLRYIVLADCFGSKIKLKETNQFLQPKADILYLVGLLQNEYLVKISSDKTFITGLHPVRSGIIRRLLFDGEIHVESEHALDALSFISGNTILNFLRNAFRHSQLSPQKLLTKLQNFTPQKWQTYLQIFKALLWKGIDDYVTKNMGTLNKVYADYNKGWITVVDFDFSGIMEVGGMMGSSTIFSEKQKQYAKKINKEFTDREEVMTYCTQWIKGIKKISSIPNNKDDWDAFGLFLFWLQYFNNMGVDMEISKYEIEGNLYSQPLETTAHVLFGLKMYNGNALIYAEKIEKEFLKMLSQSFNIISIEQKDGALNSSYLVDIVDEKFETEESDTIHAKTMKIIDLLRFAFPDKELYGTKGIGHKFSFLSDSYDSSIKQISKKNLPLKPLTEINSTYINIFNYTTRLSSWKEYVNTILNKRQYFIKVLNYFTKAFAETHKQKSLEPLRLYVLKYVKTHEENTHLKNPLLPKNATDEWGDYGESGLNNHTDIPAISFHRYKGFEKTFNEYSNSIENFLFQSGNIIIDKMKSINEKVGFDVDSARISLVGNLYKAYEIIADFQNSFKSHFEKFVDPYLLKKIEKEETENVSILCFLYRQFIYSDAFLNGNVSKLALNRLKDTDMSFKKKVTSSFRQFAKDQGIQVKVEFDEKGKRCMIIADLDNPLEIIEQVGNMYNTLFELIGQPDWNSIKCLTINTKYPVFNILPLFSGKTINATWYEFKAYNLREKEFDELEQFNLIPQEIPRNIIEKYNLKAWNKTLKEFKNLDKLLESITTAYHLAFHFLQLGSFEGKDAESYGEEILKSHIEKTGRLFQENLQTALDLYANYATWCNEGKISFNDDVEKLEFFELMIENHHLFYPNDTMFEQGKFNISLSPKEMEAWIPRLEKLNGGIAVVYYFLAGKVIGGQIGKD